MMAQLLSYAPTWASNCCVGWNWRPITRTTAWYSGPLGAPLNPMTLTRTYQAFAKNVGLQEAKIHDLRHFHASVMLQNGQSMVLVSKRLGHRSVTTTADVYAHLLPGWQKEAANAFAKAMERG